MSTKNSHPVFARVYARLRPVMDRQGAAEHRARLLFDFPPGQPSPAAPHMLGRAVREVAV